MSNRKELTEHELYVVLDTIIPGEDLMSEVQPAKPRIYFTRLSMSGLQEMYEYSVSDKRFYEYLEYDPFTSIAETEVYLKKLIELESEIYSRTSIGWFVKRTEDNRIIGTARLINIDCKRQSVTWGYGIDPKLWGQGYVQEIQRALLDYIFNKLYFNRLSGSAMLENRQTVTTLLSIGVKEEGCHRQVFRDSKGVYHDSWSYGMLYDDYKASKAWISKDLNPKVEQVINKEKIGAAQVESLLREFLHEYGDVDINHAFGDLPYWDSLKQMELVTFIETKVGITVTFDQILQLNSIHSVIETLTK
jgi:RimJ/RimL family protein N-acetyltransferase/acyl carrier protein